ncbi:MAG: ATP-binding cassette domain-containing protein, partial [Pseudoclavibacter sp.]
MTTTEQGAPGSATTAPQRSAAIVADDLSISYVERAAGIRHDALSGATFTVERGSVLGVVGTAGSGKTALGRVLSGRGLGGRDAWPYISGGSLRVADLDLRHPSRIERRRVSLDIGYLAQGSGDELRNDLTIAENMAEPILSRDRSFDKRLLGRAAALLIDAVELDLGMLNRF